MRTFKKQFPGFTKVEVRSYVTIMLKTNVEWAKRACIRVYENQSSSEQRNHISINENDIGFNRFDAPKLSSIACKIKKRHKISKQEECVLLSKMYMYSNQVIDKADTNKLLKLLRSYYERAEQMTMPF